MSDTEFAIPVFQPGQRVRVSTEPYEARCPHCNTVCGGYLGGTRAKLNREWESGIVESAVEPGELIKCNHCQSYYPAGKGFYAILFPYRPDWLTAIPWTRLEALDE